MELKTILAIGLVVCPFYISRKQKRRQNYGSFL